MEMGKVRLFECKVGDACASPNRETHICAHRILQRSFSPVALIPGRESAKVPAADCDEHENLTLTTRI